jgi:uncharacterized protein (DUF433 family)
MTVTAMDGHIAIDDRGIARVAGTRLKVTHLVMDKMANGSTAEQMRESYPHLSLAQIHAAMSYYYDHKTEMDAQIDESLRLADEYRAQAAHRPSRQELLERLAHKSRANGTEP